LQARGHDQVEVAEGGAASGRRRLSDHAYERLFRAIAGGAHAEGARLPAEAVLARELGVSRPVVREALARLRADGIVVSRPGAGSFVRRRPDPQTARPAGIGSIADLLDCLQVRQGLEGEAAFQAALRRSAVELRRLRAAHAAFEAEIRTADPKGDADRCFHQAVVEASGNRILIDLFRQLGEPIAFTMSLARAMSLGHPVERQEIVLAEHRAILEAIARSDPEAARTLMRAHIDYARRRLLGDPVRALGRP
jgi:GntR family transcriptional regulator, transcriptional repressor for pyruvate dehydrogenase complex